MCGFNLEKLSVRCGALTTYEGSRASSVSSVLSQFIRVTSAGESFSSSCKNCIEKPVRGDSMSSIE